MATKTAKFTDEQVSSAVSAKSAKSAKSDEQVSSSKVCILSRPEADKLQDSISRRGKVLESDVQRLIVTAIGYCNVHGDISIAQRMYTALSGLKGFRLQAVVNLCEAFGNMKFDDKGINGKPATKNFLHIKQFKLINEKAKTNPAEIVTELMLPDNHWTVFTKAPATKSSIDVFAKVSELVASVEKRVKKGEEVANAGLVKMLNLTLAEYQSMLANEADKFIASKKQHAEMDDAAKQLAANEAYQASVKPPMAEIGTSEVK